MADAIPIPTGPDAETDWQKNQRLLRAGFPDLAYVPKGRSGWNMTLAALAYSARRNLAGSADLFVIDKHEWSGRGAVAAGIPPSCRRTSDLSDTRGGARL